MKVVKVRISELKQTVEMVILMQQEGEFTSTSGFHLDSPRILPAVNLQMLIAQGFARNFHQIHHFHTISPLSPVFFHSFDSHPLG